MSEFSFWFGIGIEGFGVVVTDVMCNTESMAMGQPISLAKKFILMPAATWRYYAG